MQVFDDMEDYEYFLELLEKANKRENVEIPACCLMLNHFQPTWARAMANRNSY